MKTEEKQKINKTIAEAMGLKVEGPLGNQSSKIVFIKNSGLPGTFNPLESISDAFKAVKKLGLWLHLFGLHDVDREGYSAAVGKTVNTRFRAEAETPAAAVSLALVQYIKEEK